MVRVFGLLCVLLLAVLPASAQDAGDAGGESAPPVPVAAPDAPPTADEDAAETTEASGDAASTPAAVETPAGGEEVVPAEGDGRFVVVCPIDEEIDEGIAVVVKRAVKEAENAEALLFIINTPGGRVDSAIEITTAIMSVDCPTIAFIEGMGAISAGAIISYACDFMYMAEGSNIGASTPIMPGVETTEAMDEKSNSFIRSKYKALGEANGHEPLLGEAMVDRNIEVRAYLDADGVYHFRRTDDARDESSERSSDFLDKVLDAVSEDPEGGEALGELLREVLNPGGVGDTGGTAPAPAPETEANEEADEEEAEAWIEANTEIVSRKGELLTLSSREAVKYQLAESITADVDETLRKHLLGSVNRLTITPTWEEALFAFLTSPTIAGLLLMAGLGGIYVEVRTPGFGAPGIIGATCLALFFGSHMVLGMADWIDVALIMCGFLLILAEVFLLPGFGVAGILGFVCLIGGAYLAMVKAPIPDPSFYWEMLDTHEALYSLTVTVITFLIFVVASGFILPYTPMGRLLILREAQPVAGGFTAQTDEEAHAILGHTGTATTPLRPAGQGRFGGKKYDVVTRGEFIEPGTSIRVIESSGNRHVVTEVKTEERG